MQKYNCSGLIPNLSNVVFAVATAAAMPTVALAADVAVAGRQMRLADSTHPVGRRNLVGLLDARIDLSGVDPRITGATISIGPVNGPATVLSLPPGGWTLTGNAPRIDFKYKSRTGAVEAARLASGQQIRFTAKGQDA